MKFTGSDASRAMDREAIDVCGVPGAELMLRAAQGAAAQARKMLPPGGAALILCGSGNNGGDGVGVAALLQKDGIPAACVMVGDKEKLSQDSRQMLALLEESGGALIDYVNLSTLSGAYSLIVDALFGTGLSRPIGGKYAEIIDYVNNSGIPVLSCDIPSGISADTGEVLGRAVRADVTVTFHLPKTGHLLPPGTEYTGRLIVHDIGIPPSARAKGQSAGEYVTLPEALSWLPPRNRESHKGDFGKLLLLCGSAGFTGAAALASRAALRSGAGLVYLGVPEQIYPILAAKLDEPVVFPLPGNDSGRLSPLAIPAILQRLPEMDAVLIGPGLGWDGDTRAVVQAVLETAACPVLLDADGINVLAGHIDILERAKAPLVMTPHLGEARRLSADLPENRIAAAQALAARTGAVIALKGHRTVTASPEGEIYVNSTGNSGMATGGSGDVLSGILATFLAQGLPPVQAAATAVCIHGAAGDRCASRLGERSMLPSDMIEALPEILR